MTLMPTIAATPRAARRDRAEQHHASVVDEGVEPAELARRSARPRLVPARCSLTSASITSAPPPLAIRPASAVSRSHAPRDDRDRAPCSGEGHRGCLTDAARRAGDERDGAVELAISSIQRNPTSLGARRQRARRQPRRGIVLVEADRREVVGRVGVKQRREVLGLAAARAELELAAAVGADAALGAVVVGGAELAQAADPRRLDVDHPRRERQRLDVVDRVDRRVPGDPLVVAGEHRRGLGVTTSGSSIHASGNASTTRR